MLSKPSTDFATLAALPEFRALIDCSDAYYKEFTDTICRAAATGRLEALPWSTEPCKTEIAELWNNRDALKDACRQWRSQPVMPCCVRLSPESPEGKYDFKEIG